MSTVISIENLNKEYRLGVIGHGTLYRDLQSWWARARGQDDPNSLLGDQRENASGNRILALNGIDLKVSSGEVLGIIGANGAGKSTLLKVLSRVTAPSSGQIKVRGKIASLLEVGTGFHPELTGRENVYLNGAINGMTRRTVNAKLDEIIDFAGIGKFLDTPVKRYSSGMYVRLGFSVAAHLDPDILVVDEVLSVGDAQFRKKAIGKMQEVSSGQGRTVLFVSHNMTSIRRLCTRAILIGEGKILYDAKPEQTISRYMRAGEDSGKVNLADRRDRSGDGRLRFTEIILLDEEGRPVGEPVSGQPLSLSLRYVSKGFIDPFSFALDLRLNDENGIEVAAISSIEMAVNFGPLHESGEFVVEFEKLMLRGRAYSLDIYSSENGPGGRRSLDNVSGAIKFDIATGDYWDVGNNNGSGAYVLLDCKIDNRRCPSGAHV